MFESNIGKLADNVIGEGLTDARHTALTGGFKKPNRWLAVPSDPVRKYARDEWPQLMALQEKHRTSPYHVHVDYKIPLINQRATNYCWCFGVTQGIMNRYAAMDGSSPRLSPNSAACQGKNFRNEGGWGSEAIEYIEKYGLAEQKYWPENSFNRDLVGNEEVKASAAKHGLIKFKELPAYNLDSMMSVLLDPYNPSPVSVGYTWWGHLVVALQAIRYQGEWGVIIANSWGADWGDRGYGVLLGSKAIAAEAIAIQSIKPIGVEL